jgi:hypothetical protein
MDVAIPKSGDQRESSTINDPGIAGDFDLLLLTHSNDPTVFDENDAICYRCRGRGGINFCSEKCQAITLVWLRLSTCQQRRTAQVTKQEQECKKLYRSSHISPCSVPSESI